MSESLDRIEARARNLELVDSVVSAVWAIAGAQLPKVESAVAESETYLTWLSELVERVAGPERVQAGPAQLHVVLGPDKSFCGALSRQLAARIPREGALGLVGRSFFEGVEAQRGCASRLVFKLPGPTTVEDAQNVAEQVAAAVLDQPRGRVDLWYPTPHAHLTRVPLLTAFDRTACYPPDVYCTHDEVLEVALSELVAGRLTFGLLESLRIETRARLLTTESARRNIERRLDELAQDLRQIRRNQITDELLEIVGGHRVQVATR